MRKILIIFGTRPEAIKMAPLIKEFQKHIDIFDTKVCVTAQHREMMDQVLKIFGIKPDYDLNIMTPDQDLYDITSKVMLSMRTVLKEEKPDIVFVHGDTTTAMATAISAFYQKIKIAHVEAGLRTYNLFSPWPEEMNRQLTDRICDYYFAPTERSKNNLLSENIKNSRIIITGNTVIDALLMIIDIIKKNEELQKVIRNDIMQKGYNIISAENRKIILVTGHRRENFGEGFINICEALKKIALYHKNFDIVYPVHLNPNVQKPVYELLKNIKNIYLIPPLDYAPFVYLMQRSYLILTDSGGIQEEAPSLGKPVLVMRNTTERPEAVEAGGVKLVGTDVSAIVENVRKIIEDEATYYKMAQAHNPYGDGNACKIIIESLIGAD
jgi:UDP-N-acetylglucosamine 2-epimerase (non-hydrolysing)